LLKKLLLLVISFLFIIGGSVSASETVTYNIKEIDVNVDIPAEYLVFTRNIKDDDPALQKSGLTKDFILSYLESGNMYLCAMPEDNEFEIYLSYITTDENVPSFSELTPEGEKTLIRSITDNLAVSNMQPSNFSFYDNNGKMFIKYEIQQNKTDYMLSHSTLYDKKNINIMLRPASGQFTDNQRNIIEEIAHSIRYNAPSEPVTTEEPERSLKMKDYILTFAPIVILILVIGGLVLIVKRREKNQKNSGKNTVRVNFENTCTAYERPTLFLRIYVIYLLPLHAVFNVLFIIASIINGHGHSVLAVILSVILQLIIVFCIYFVRKNAMLLNKKGYIFIIAYFALTSVSNCWQEGPDLAKTVVYFVAFLLFYIYMNKRKSLFLN